MRAPLIFLIVSVVVIAGCASQPAETQPSFRILSPAEGQVLTGDDAVISLQTEGVIIASPTGEVIPNQGHFHFFLDNANEIVTPAAVYTYENLTPGLHIIRIELRRGDHSAFNPAIIKSVSFTVPGLPSPITLPSNTSCTTDSDCVPAQCCHPISTVNKQFAPNCTSVACTLQCAPDTLDCGQGEPACVSGQCTVRWTPPANTTNTTSQTNTTNTSSMPPPVKEFNVTATSWTFTPDTLTVNKDDKVIINARSTDNDHGLAITAYNVNLFLDGGGATQTATFTADKTGEFTFFCSVACGAGHGNMKGKLVVNP